MHRSCDTKTSMMSGIGRRTMRPVFAKSLPAPANLTNALGKPDFQQKFKSLPGISHAYRKFEDSEPHAPSQVNFANQDYTGDRSSSNTAQFQKANAGLFNEFPVSNASEQNHRNNESRMGTQIFDRAVNHTGGVDVKRHLVPLHSNVKKPVNHAIENNLASSACVDRQFVTGTQQGLSLHSKQSVIPSISKMIQNQEENKRATVNRNHPGCAVPQNQSTGFGVNPEANATRTLYGKQPVIPGNNRNTQNQDLTSGMIKRVQSSYALQQHPDMLLGMNTCTTETPKEMESKANLETQSLYGNLAEIQGISKRSQNQNENPRSVLNRVQSNYALAPNPSVTHPVAAETHTDMNTRCILETQSLYGKQSVIPGIKCIQNKESLNSKGINRVKSSLALKSGPDVTFDTHAEELKRQTDMESRRILATQSLYGKQSLIPGIKCSQNLESVNSKGIHRIQSSLALKPNPDGMNDMNAEEHKHHTDIESKRNLETKSLYGKQSVIPGIIKCSQNLEYFNSIGLNRVKSSLAPKPNEELEIHTEKESKRIFETKSLYGKQSVIPGISRTKKEELQETRILETEGMHGKHSVASDFSNKCQSQMGICNDMNTGVSSSYEVMAPNRDTHSLYGKQSVLPGITKSYPNKEETGNDVIVRARSFYKLEPNPETELGKHEKAKEVHTGFEATKHGMEINTAMDLDQTIDVASNAKYSESMEVQNFDQGRITISEEKIADMLNENENGECYNRHVSEGSHDNISYERREVMQKEDSNSINEAYSYETSQSERSKSTGPDYTISYKRREMMRDDESVDLDIDCSYKTSQSQSSRAAESENSKVKVVNKDSERIHQDSTIQVAATTTPSTESPNSSKYGTGIRITDILHENESEKSCHQKVSEGSNNYIFYKTKTLLREDNSLSINAGNDYETKPSERSKSAKSDTNDVNGVNGVSIMLNEAKHIKDMASFSESLKSLKYDQGQTNITGEKMAEILEDNEDSECYNQHVSNGSNNTFTFERRGLMREDEPKSTHVANSCETSHIGKSKSAESETNKVEMIINSGARLSETQAKDETAYIYSSSEEKMADMLIDKCNSVKHVSDFNQTIIVNKRREMAREDESIGVNVSNKGTASPIEMSKSVESDTKSIQGKTSVSENLEQTSVLYNNDTDTSQNERSVSKNVSNCYSENVLTEASKTICSYETSQSKETQFIEILDDSNEIPSTIKRDNILIEKKVVEDFSKEANNKDRTRSFDVDIERKRTKGKESERYGYIKEENNQTMERENDGGFHKSDQSEQNISSEKASSKKFSIVESKIIVAVPESVKRKFRKRKAYREKQDSNSTELIGYSSNVSSQSQDNLKQNNKTNTTKETYDTDDDIDNVPDYIFDDDTDSKLNLSMQNRHEEIVESQRKEVCSGNDRKSDINMNIIEENENETHENHIESDDGTGIIMEKALLNKTHVKRVTFADLPLIHSIKRLETIIMELNEDDDNTGGYDTDEDNHCSDDDIALILNTPKQFEPHINETGCDLIRKGKVDGDIAYSKSKSKPDTNISGIEEKEINAVKLETLIATDDQSKKESKGEIANPKYVYNKVSDTTLDHGKGKGGAVPVRDERHADINGIGSLNTDIHNVKKTKRRRIRKIRIRRIHRGSSDSKYKSEKPIKQAFPKSIDIHVDRAPFNGDVGHGYCSEETVIRKEKKVEQKKVTNSENELKNKCGIKNRPDESKQYIPLSLERTVGNENVHEYRIMRSNNDASTQTTFRRKKNKHLNKKKIETDNRRKCKIKDNICKTSQDMHNLSEKPLDQASVNDCTANTPTGIRLKRNGQTKTLNKGIGCQQTNNLHGDRLNRYHPPVTFKPINYCENEPFIESKYSYNRGNDNINEYEFDVQHKTQFIAAPSNAVRSESYMRIMNIMETKIEPDRAVDLMRSKTITEMLDNLDKDPMKYGLSYAYMVKFRDQNYYSDINKVISDPTTVYDDRPTLHHFKHERLRMSEPNPELERGCNDFRCSTNTRVQNNRWSETENICNEYNSRCIGRTRRNKCTSESDTMNIGESIERKGNDLTPTPKQKRSNRIKSFFRSLICICKPKIDNENV